MNALVGLNKEPYEQNELCATFDDTTKAVKLVEDFTVSLTDTFGFIQNLPKELSKAFKSTLEETANVDLLIDVVDASNPHQEIHEQTVLKIMQDLQVINVPVLDVYNKMEEMCLVYKLALISNRSISNSTQDRINGRDI